MFAVLRVVFLGVAAAPIYLFAQTDRPIIDDANPVIETIPSELPKILDTKTGDPVRTTLCELVKSPEHFNRRILVLRGRIQIASEDFELDLSNCTGGTLQGIWLEYGRGPKHQPTIWCCGNIDPNDPLRLNMNRDFRAFHRYLTAQKRGKGCYEGECLLFDVTATLTGRFDLTPSVTCPDGKSRCAREGGFGHFGLFIARLVIQSVSDVVAKPSTSP
jgi:hypothetical protein